MNRDVGWLHHITFLSILLMSLFTIMQGWIHHNFLSIPFPYWHCWRNPAALELPHDPVLLSYWWCLSNDVRLCVYRGGSHQHLALVVIIWLFIIPPQFPRGFPNPRHNMVKWIEYWVELKSCGYSGMVINFKTSVALLCHRSWTWRLSLDHGKMVSPMNVDLCSTSQSH